MKTYQVIEDEVSRGIDVSPISLNGNGKALPAIVVGDGGEEPETCVFVKEEDVKRIVQIARIEEVDCHEEGSKLYLDDDWLVVYNVDVERLSNGHAHKYPGRYILTKPNGKRSKCILVYWEVSMGLMGHAEIYYHDKAIKIAHGCGSYKYEGCDTCFKTVQTLAVLRPFQYLCAVTVGLNERDVLASLLWTGRTLEVDFYEIPMGRLIKTMS